MAKVQDFQEMLHEVLDTKLFAKTKQEKLLQEILKKEEKKVVTTDFQELLRKSVVSFNEDKVKKQLENKVEDKKDIKKDVNISKQIKSGANVEKIVKDIEKEDEDSKINKEASKTDEKLSSREIALKYMYSEALEEYYKLKNDLTKKQIKENDISLDDKNYTKLLMYENYLRKCDMLFKNTNGQFISNQDEEIFKKENKYAYDDAISERKIINEHDERVTEIDRLNEQIKIVADKIIFLNEAQETGRAVDYEEQLKLLENDYANLNGRLHALTPNIIELYRQEEKKEEQEKITTRVVGTLYEDKKNKSVLDEDVVRLDKNVEQKEESQKDIAEREKLEHQSINLHLADSYLKAAKRALFKNNTAEATEFIGKAREIVGYKKVLDIAGKKDPEFKEALKENVITSNNTKVEKVVDEKALDEERLMNEYICSIIAEEAQLSEVQKQCVEAVYEPEKRDENVLARQANESLKKVEREKNKEDGKTK